MSPSFQLYNTLGNKIFSVGDIYVTQFTILKNAQIHNIKHGHKSKIDRVTIILISKNIKL